MQDSDTEYHTAQDDESTDLDEELQAPDLPDAEEPAPSAIKKSLRQEAQTARMAGLDYKGCKLLSKTRISIECRIFPFSKTRIFLNCNL